MGKIRELKKENKALKEDLKTAAYLEYRQMEKYLSLSAIHGIDREIAKKEMLGMFLEAQARGDEETIALDEDREAFLKELVKSSRARSLEEMVATFCRFFFVQIFVFAMAMWLLEGAPGQIQLNGLNLLTTVGIGALYFPICWLESKTVYRSDLIQFLFVVLFYGAFIAVGMRLQWLRGVAVAVMPWWTIGLLAVAAVGSFLWMERASERDLKREEK